MLMKDRETYAGSPEGGVKSAWMLFLELIVMIAVIFSFISVVQLGVSGEKSGGNLPEYKLFLRYR
jgi:hypothetical protein